MMEERTIRKLLQLITEIFLILLSFNTIKNRKAITYQTTDSKESETKPTKRLLRKVAICSLNNGF